VLGAGWWGDVGRMVMGDVLGVLWMRVWGAEGEGTVMVNAAVVDVWTGMVRHGATIVDI